MKAQKIGRTITELMDGLQVCHISFIPGIDDYRKRIVHHVDAMVIIIIIV
jgi:hypothetical protein